jgi:hypothetical protein
MTARLPLATSTVLRARKSQVFTVSCMRAILSALRRLLRVRPVTANKPSVQEMERQVALLREKIRYLQVMAMRPGNSSKDLERLRWLERAGRAQVKRRVSEIALEKGKQAVPRIRESHRKTHPEPFVDRQRYS